jgi:hypothetical protein
MSFYTYGLLMRSLTNDQGMKTSPANPATLPLISMLSGAIGNSHT